MIIQSPMQLGQCGNRELHSVSFPNHNQTVTSGIVLAPGEETIKATDLTGFVVNQYIELQTKTL